jgi:hypothetical protein
MKYLLPFLALWLGFIYVVACLNTTHKELLTPEDRAQSLEIKDCYTQQDIDYIVFGESQE